MGRISYFPLLQFMQKKKKTHMWKEQELEAIVITMETKSIMVPEFLTDWSEIGRLNGEVYMQNWF